MTEEDKQGRLIKTTNMIQEAREASLTGAALVTGVRLALSAEARSAAIRDADGTQTPITVDVALATVLGVFTDHVAFFDMVRDLALARWSGGES